MSERLETPDPSDHLWDSFRPEAVRRLLRVGVAVFAELGYHGATTRFISQRAAMSPAGMYIHFPTKADLLFRITMTGHEHSLSTLRGAVDSTEDPLERIHAAISAYTTWHARYHRLARVTQYESRSLPPEMWSEVRQIRAQFEKIIKEILIKGAGAGVLNPTGIDVSALMILSLSADVVRWYSSHAAWTPEELGLVYADNLTALLVSGISDRTALAPPLS